MVRLTAKRALRIEDWWGSKAALLMGMVYLFSAWFQIPIYRFPWLALLSISTIAGFASFGYLINDLFDIEADAQAGKKNFLANKSPMLITAIFLGSLVFLLLPWRFLPFTEFSASLMVTEVVLFLAYSAPPIRLKEKGMAGVLVDALYAHVLPVVLISYTYSLAGGKPFKTFPTTLMCVWQLFSGLRNIILHQWEDIPKDKKANVRNFVSTLQPQSVPSLIRNLLFAELFFSILFFTAVALHNPPFFFGVGVIVIASLVAWLLFRKGIDKMLHSGWRYFPNNIYEKWLSAVNGLLLCFTDVRFLLVLFLHLALFNSQFYVETYRIISPILRDFFIHAFLIPLKIIVNHIIYYSFKIFGVDLKERNISAYEFVKAKFSGNESDERTHNGSLKEISNSSHNTNSVLPVNWKLGQVSDLKGQNVFVFVVCGLKEHIDTLHYSLKALKKVSRCEIVIVTDSHRNEEAVIHDRLVDIKTPAYFTHHQASIFLKTALHKILPQGNTYCYLDTDIVALDKNVDQIFEHFVAPITFAPDLNLMDKFSPSAVNCGCIQQHKAWASELRMLFKRYKHLARQPENLEKKTLLLSHFDRIKKNKISYAFTSFRFWLATRKFKLHQDAILDKRNQVWVDKEGNAILYEKEDTAIAEIERTTNYRCDRNNHHVWTINGHEVFDCRCNHLQEQIARTFGIQVTNSHWQHWNGGVFLFNDASHSFLESWHQKTMRIFNDPAWKTRDQGTLIATVWEMGLENHPTLSVEFNLIADYHHLTMKHQGDLVFYLNEQQSHVVPHFIHVYHHWADKNWDVWQAVEKKTGMAVTPESNVFNALWIGKHLSTLELLTIKSFLAKGHAFKLWLYDELETPLPKGVEVGDASTIIPRSDVFSYKHSNKYGHGKGSYAGFSDIFRYKLLYEQGGWWVDMDVTCLKHFDFDKPYFFRGHHELKVVGNVMRCPRHSKLMQLCYEEAVASVKEDNRDWHKPIDILNKHIVDLHLEGYIVKDVSNNDHWDITEKYLWGRDEFPYNWYFIHWQNEEWRAKHISKTDYYYHSALAELLYSYHLATPPASVAEEIINTFRHSKYFRHLFNDSVA